jgi:hypothetical protein
MEIQRDFAAGFVDPREFLREHQRYPKIDLVTRLDVESMWRRRVIHE